jgi:hypothetical protein
VSEALQQLTSEDAALAEAMILPDLPGKTHGQVVKLAVQAAITVDPESVTRRREDAERNLSRVTMFREESGAAALSGRDLPTDQTLAAHASVCARAQEYEESGAFPDGIRMDQYRVAAYLDLLNGVTVEVRITSGLLPGTSDGHGDDPDDGSPGSEGSCGPRHGGPTAGGSRQDGDADPDAGHGSGKRSDSGNDQSGGQQAAQPPLAATAATSPRLADLVLPLATLLGLAERPGEGHGLGPLDPTLCRELAIAAAASPDSRLCVTVTDADGIAIGHGCARAARHGRRPAGINHSNPTDSSRPGPLSGAVALPARMNLTVTAARLAELARPTRPPGQASWAFIRDTGTGPPTGYGGWTLILPDGRNLNVELQPVPTFGCDHRFESHAYQPNDTLRHLVQVRDGDCTFPTCSRHARESDFEHATPYDKGGRTCACNAGARSRACHQVKQSPGWNVTQPRPGWHQWVTPSGRAYIQGPKRYPA